MLRGLDMWGKSDADPIIVKAADREPLAGQVTIYASENLSPDSHDRFRTVLDSFERLEAAEVVDEPRVTSWPKQVEGPTDGPEAAAVSCYEEFVDATSADALEPQFTARDTEDGRVIDFADLCIAIRRDGELTGLYPCDGAAIEDCLSALAAGNPVENLD